MYRQYDEETLKRVQNTEKEILVKFIEICEKYNLKYFAAFGTLLGAIRHRGFIPWDDDIDVGMLRKDYEKFLKVAQKECGKEFFIQTVDTDPKYHLFFGKMRMCNTQFVENSLQQADSVTGFYIDIFPFDAVPDEKKKMTRQLKKAERLSILLSVNKVKEPQIGNYSKAKTSVMRGIWYILHYGMKIFHITGEKIWRSCEKTFSKYDQEETQQITCFFPDAEKWLIKISELDQLEEILFEDIKIKVPVGYDAILTRNYGDYMKLPPKEKRINHMPVTIQFPGEEKLDL
ncbi:LPS biosynthesis protein [uncultured Dorea sp.]|uniref:LicD family protein n=1 Tax=Dorea formicigenerans TaxID=39486 RepID=UPI000821731C|nr:LicD family protein [uncultured Dorea sp.]SCH25998.1 LPS biosynthesis protein [uncultured Dorea sp.]